MTRLEGAEAVKALIGHGKAMAEPFAHPRGGMAVVVPDGYRVEHLQPVDPLLTHIKAAPVFDDAQSLIDYLLAFPSPSARLFAEQDRARITAVIDYHQQNAPGYGAHRATCILPPSEQWGRWTAIDGELMPQAAFAEFIEENALDIYEPASAAVLEIARSLSIKQSVEFASSINLANGATQLKYVEQQDGKGRGDIEVPQKIKLGLPVYFGGELVEVWAFLRTRIAGGRLSFMVKLHRKAIIEQEEFRRVIAQIAKATGIAPLYGRP